MRTSLIYELENKLSNNHSVSLDQVKEPLEKILEKHYKSLLLKNHRYFGNRPSDVVDEIEKKCADDFRYNYSMCNKSPFRSKEDLAFVYDYTAEKKIEKLLEKLDGKVKEYDRDCEGKDDCEKCRLELEIIELLRCYVQFANDTFPQCKMLKAFLEHKIYECDSECVALINVSRALEDEQRDSLSEQIRMIICNGAESDTEWDTQRNMCMFKSVINEGRMKKEEEVRRYEELLQQADTEEIYTEEYRKAVKHDEWLMETGMEDYDDDWEYPKETLPEPEDVDRTNLHMLKESYESLFQDFFRSAESYKDVYKKSVGYFYSCPSVNNLLVTSRCPKYRSTEWNVYPIMQ